MMEDLSQLSTKVTRVQRLVSQLHDQLPAFCNTHDAYVKAVEDLNSSLATPIAPYREPVDKLMHQLFNSYRKFLRSVNDARIAESNRIIDVLVSVLSRHGRWMGIKALTNKALAAGVNTKSAAPVRAFSSLLSSESKKKRHRVVLRDGEWGLPEWLDQRQSNMPSLGAVVPNITHVDQIDHGVTVGSMPMATIVHESKKANEKEGE